MKKVEERALNLTSRLLMKEMEAGMMKKENIKMEEQLKQTVEKEVKDKTSATRPESDLKSEENNEKIESSLKVAIANSTKNADDNIEEIIPQVNEKEEIVGKLLDIKKKQHELDQAKKEFFSETVNNDEPIKNENGDAKQQQMKELPNTTINITQTNNKKLPIEKEEKIDINQEEIQKLIQLPDTQNEIKNISFSNPQNKTNDLVDKPQNEESKIHIILDVNNKSQNGNTTEV